MLVIIVQIIIPVSDIDDKIIAVMFFFFRFYGILVFILALYLGLQILNRRFLGSNIG